MNLLYTIKQKLEQINNDELLRNMGYHNLKAGQRTLHEFLEIDNIYLFLKNGSFDFKYNSEEFLQHLLRALDLTSEGNDELKQYNRRLDAIRAMRNTPYIFIDTHFKRESQPIFVLLIMEYKRNIQIDKELLVFKSGKEILVIIGDIVKNHYITSNGKIQLWGDIVTYNYHNTYDNKYIFNPDGTLMLSPAY